MAKAQFIIGCCGGDYYGFSNSREATAYIKSDGVVVHKLCWVIVRELTQAGFSVSFERNLIAEKVQ